MKHMPSGLLHDAQVAGQLIRANPVLRVGNQPDRSQPLIEASGLSSNIVPTLSEN